MSDYHVYSVPSGDGNQQSAPSATQGRSASDDTTARLFPGYAQLSRGTADGVPSGFDPHKPLETVITVDPGVPGGQFEILASALPTAFSGNRPAAPDVLDGDVVDAWRDQLAAQLQAQALNQHSVPVQVGADKLSEASTAAFASYTTKQADSISAPTCMVTYETESYGKHTVGYSDVLIAPEFLVLVWDIRNPGSMYAPPVGPDVPAMALYIAGTDRAFLVYSTGVQYQYAGYEFCILFVAQSMAWPPESGAK